MFCRHVFGNISGGFRGISRFFGNFAGPRPREISEALFSDTVICCHCISLHIPNSLHIFSMVSKFIYIIIFIGKSDATRW